MHGWKVVASYDAVPDSCLPDDGYAGFCKRGDIPVNRSDARLEFICNFLGACHPAALQMNQDGDESIDSIHIA